MMFFSKPKGKLTMALPYVIVFGLIGVAGGTEWFSAQLHQQVLGQLKLYYQALLPLTLNLCWAFLIVYTAHLIFGVLRSGFVRFLKAQGATEKGQSFFMLLFQAVYWIVVVFMALRAVAPDWLQNVMLSGGIFVGVVALAAQKALGNVVSSLCLHVLPKVGEGDHVKIVGVDSAEGTIVEIGYLSCKIQTKDGRVMTLPNSSVWDNPTLTGDPPADTPEDPKVVKVILVEDQSGGKPPATESK
jgi:small-conductance mechanosensitive channel